MLETKFVANPLRNEEGFSVVSAYPSSHAKTVEIVMRGCKERHRFPCSYCDATFTAEGERQRHEEDYCRVPPEPMEEEWLEDRFEKLQILQHNPEIWRGYVHASNGTSYGYWLSKDNQLCYLGLDYETMKERLTTIQECQRWMYA